MIAFTYRRLLTTGAAAGALAALPGAALAAPGARSPRAAPTFVPTGAPAGNAVIAYDRAANGSLRRSATYPTGGDGGRLDGSQVDHLGSQGSLAVTRSDLYTVNAGSDSLTVFRRHGDRLTGRQIVASGGTFPVSVTVHGDLVYVLNARRGGTIQGYRRTDAGLEPLAGSHVSLRLDTGRRPEYKATPGQVLFSPDGHRLVVTTKNSSNAVEVFTLGRTGAPAGAPTTHVLPGTLPFGVNFDANGHLIVSLVGTSTLSAFAIGRDGTLSRLASVKTGGTAACWNASVGNMVYVANAGTSTISEIRDSGSKLTLVQTIAGPMGATDEAPSPDGRFLEVRGGALGQLATYAIGSDGLLTSVQTLTVPHAVGGEGIGL